MASSNLDSRLTAAVGAGQLLPAAAENIRAFLAAGLVYEPHEEDPRA